MKQMIVLCFLFIIGACSTTFKEGIQDSAQHTRNGEINFGGNSSVQVTH